VQFFQNEFEEALPIGYSIIRTLSNFEVAFALEKDFAKKGRLKQDGLWVFYK